MSGSSLRRFFAVASAIGLSACSDSTGPSGTVVEVLGGDGQLGLAGWTLDQSLSVLVRGADGTPMQGAWVEFTVTAGGGAPASPLVFTDEDGVATTRWLLGDEGLQRLTANQPGAGPASASAEFHAGLLAASEADLVVVHGALGPMRGAMLSSENGSFGNPVSGVAVDTLIPVPPRSGRGSAVALFGQDNRPLIVEPAWTEGYDTVHVTLEPPVSIDLWMDIREGDYDEMVERLETALDTVELIWGASGTGVTIGSVTWVDRTGLQPVWVTEPCADYLALPPMRIRVSVVAAIGYEGAEGHACAHDLAFVTGRGLGDPGAVLIAHELGHTFSLRHVSRGVMGTGRAIADRLHDGETFIAHFDDGSALNVLYSSQPVEQRRPCRFAADACPPPLLELALP